MVNFLLLSGLVLANSAFAENLSIAPVEVEVIDYLNAKQSELVRTIPEFREAVVESLGQPDRAAANILSAQFQMKSEVDADNHLEGVEPNAIGLSFTNQTNSGCGIHKYSIIQMSCESESCTIDFTYKSNDTCESSRPQMVFVPLSDLRVSREFFRNKEIKLRQVE